MTDMNTEYSAEPGVPQTPTKAWAATALAFLTILVSAWIADDDGTSGKEVMSWVISALVGSGLTGAVTYQVKNRKLRKQGR